MYGQRRWTVPAPPSIKLGSTTVCKKVTEMRMVLSPRCLAVTPVHTYSDLSV